MSSSSHLPATRASLDQADEAETPSKAISILYKIVQDPSTPDDWQSIKTEAITKLSILLVQEGKAGEIQDLIIQALPFFSSIPCVETINICSSIINAVAEEVPRRKSHHHISFHGIPFTVKWSDLQISMYRQIVNWSRAENRTHLRHKMEDNLAELLIECRKFSEAFDLLSRLSQESRTSENNELRLVQICLHGAKLHLSRQELPKAEAALSEALITAQSLQHMPPYDIAMFALQIGVFYVEQRDYLLAVPNFEVACIVFNDIQDPMFTNSLRYLVLCKIIWDRVDDVAKMESPGISGLYGSEEFEGMRAVADARAKRSFKLFETALKEHKDELQKDPLVRKHLDLLRDALLKDNIRRLIEPDSIAEIAEFAELFNLPVDKVEEYFSEMIEDKKLGGSLDEVAGYLIIYDDTKIDAALDIISEMGKVVDTRKQKFGE